MRPLILCAIAITLAGPSALAYAQSAAAGTTTAATYSTAATPIGTLLDDPRARAVVDGAMPGFSNSDQISMARPMTLKQIQQFAPDKITDATLAQIDAGLAKLTPAKP